MNIYVLIALIVAYITFVKEPLDKREKEREKEQDRQKLIEELKKSLIKEERHQ